VRRDEVVRVTMMPIAGNVKADVVQKRRVLQEQTVGVGEAV
jgi:hypothetical protein